MRTARISTRTALCVAILGLVASSGCVSWTAIPAYRMPRSLLATPRAGREPINLISLRQDPPPVYQLGPNDVLGVYIEGVLGTAEQPPPVHFPEPSQLSGSSLPPAIGYPMPVREDGTVALPLISPVRVAGLTLTQAEDEIRNTYIREKILPEGKQTRIIVTLMRKRTYQILVIREDSSSAQASASGEAGIAGTGLVKRGSARAIDLKAYENDVLHALTESGGLPGLDAKNEIKILRGAFSDAIGRESLMKDFDEGNSPPGISPDNPNIVRIPLRRRPEDPPLDIDEEDIILTNGDIVFIESREREVFYTGGLLTGREQLLPRDYDLDVLGALAVAGATIGTTGSGGGSSGGFYGGGLNPRGILPPTDIIIVRKTKGGYQIPIRVKLNTALKNPAERILIQPGDLIILQYTPAEMVANILLNSINIQYFINRIN
jgi:protein involved in polysaccharide export with SLBB domain